MRRPLIRVATSVAALGALTLHQMNPAMADLILTSNGSAEEDYDVISEGRLVGHIFKPTAAPVQTPWMWAFVHSRPEDRFPAPHGYAATREEAMQAFASVWYG